MYARWRTRAICQRRALMQRLLLMRCRVLPRSAPRYEQASRAPRCHTARTRRVARVRAATMYMSRFTATFYGDAAPPRHAAAARRHACRFSFTPANITVSRCHAATMREYRLPRCPLLRMACLLQLLRR